MAEFSEFKGKIITSIEGAKVGNDEIIFSLSTGEKFRLFHNQDCCESVLIEEIIGEIDDLIDSVITEAEEITSHENPEGYKPEYQGSFTWTFYKIGTKKGFVTIRWYGESNGYYGEEVDFEEVLNG
jgi:hypothetical protein